MKGFSSEMVLNKLAMASLCAVRSVEVGEGGDGESEGAEEGWWGKLKGEEEGEEWIFEWCRKSPGVGNDLGHSGHG